MHYHLIRLLTNSKGNNLIPQTQIKTDKILILPNINLQYKEDLKIIHSVLKVGIISIKNQDYRIVVKIAITKIII
jgi:hypothetical protein